MSNLSIIILRLSFVVLFLWFGFSQLINPEMWVVYLPVWTGYFPIPGEMLVQWNGWTEVVFALMILIGIQVRVMSAILGAHLILIAANVGGAVGVRDLVLGIGLIVLAMNPADKMTTDQWLSKKR